MLRRRLVRSRSLWMSAWSGDQQRFRSKFDAAEDRRTLILQRYATLKEAFRAIDTDNSGLARRAEIRTFLGRLSKSIPDGVISGLISYVDTDGDTKTLSKAEFLKMMSEEFLDDVNTEEASHGPFFSVFFFLPAARPLTVRLFCLSLSL